MLLAACARVGKSLGYMKIQTYTLPSESGASLRAAGWTLDGVTSGSQPWNTSKRARTDTHPLGRKLRWVKVLNGETLPRLARRECQVCRASLDDYRLDAKTCSNGCRQQLWRATHRAAG